MAQSRAIAMLDTGFLLAVLNSNDDFHSIGTQELEHLRRSKVPLFTSTACLVELDHLVTSRNVPIRYLYEFLQKIDLRCAPSKCDDVLAAWLGQAHYYLNVDYADFHFTFTSLSLRARAFTIDEDVEILRSLIEESGLLEPTQMDITNLRYL